MQFQASPCLVIIDLMQIAQVRPRNLARLRTILRPNQTFVYFFICAVSAIQYVFLVKSIT
jgi:hypothetical protein